MDEPIKVLVVDDQALVRDGIASLLAIQTGIRVVGTAENGLQAEEAVAQLVPDVILMDIKMPVMDGIAATQRILGAAPQIKIIMLTTLEDEEWIVKSLKSGAVGYLLKDMLAADLAQAVRLANHGIYQLAPSVAGRLIQLQTPPAKPAAQRDAYTERILALSPRERDVLKLIASGATNQEIAKALFLSQGTVKNIVSSIFSRLGIEDRVQAAVIAIQHGID